MFDLPEDSQPMGSDQINRIQADCGVIVSIRQKVKQSVLAYVIKGSERNAGKIYEARNQILGITDLPIIADIPKSYFMPVMAFDTVENAPPMINVQQPVSPMIAPMVSTSWQFPGPQICQPHGSFVGMMRAPPSFTYNTSTVVQGSSMGSSG